MEYSSGLVSQSFWFVEVKTFIQLRENGVSWEEIKEKCIKEHLLGGQKEYRTKRIYGYLKHRISMLDGELLSLFGSQSVANQKIINLVAIAKENCLFYEFLHSVYREKIILGLDSLTDTDVSAFFTEKQNQNDVVARWKEPTFKRLKSTYLNFMSDGGLLLPCDGTRKITPPILDIPLEQHLKQEHNPVWKALNGVE